MQQIVSHNFSQTVCGNFLDEFLDEFLGDFFLSTLFTQPKSFSLGCAACKLKDRSQSSHAGHAAMQAFFSAWRNYTGSLQHHRRRMHAWTGSVRRFPAS